MNNNRVFNIPTLKNITYARSKEWANFIHKLSSVAEESDMILDGFDEEFEERNEEKDNLSSMEEEEEEDEGLDILQDITTSLLHNKFNKNETLKEHLSKSSTFNNSNLQEVNAIQNFLDETLPVLEGNNRIWKESGMDSVLNTFDPKKIEQEVGGWLRQNHKQRAFPDCTNLSPILKTPTLEHSETTSEDSMHSVDTARYIRTSRKYRKLGKISPHSTMNIKTYRLVKRKRDALREKYGYLEEDDMLQFDRYFQGKNALCMSNNTHRHYVKAPTESIIYKKKHPLREERRKKRCRKVHFIDHELNTSDESLDEEVHHCAKQHRLCDSLKNKYVSYVNCHSTCACAACMRNSTRYSSVISTVPRVYRRRYVQKRLSVKRESECGCCDDDTLCEDTIHLADTSTEKWVVENLYTSSKDKAVNAPRGTEHKLKKLVKKSRSTRHYPFDEIRLNSYDNMSGIQPLSSTVLSAKSIRSLSSMKSTKKQEYGITNGIHDDNNQPNPTEKIGDVDKDNNLKNINDKDEAQCNEKNVESEQIVRKMPHSLVEAEEVENNHKNHPNSKNKFEICSNNLKSKNSRKDKEEDKRYDVKEDNDEKQKLRKKEERRKMCLKSEKANKVKDKQKATSEFKSKNKLKSKFMQAEKLDKLIEEERKEENKIQHKKINSFNNHERNCIQIAEINEQQQQVKESATKSSRSSKKVTKKENIANKKEKELNAKKTRKSKEKSLDMRCEVIDLTVENVALKVAETNISAVCDTTNCNETGGFGERAVSEGIKPTTERIYKNGNDCTTVTSTTDISPQKIMIYNPEDRETIPKNCLETGCFTITKEHLSSVLGNEAASKFLKYYAGQRKFDINSIVYFCPPKSTQDVVDTESDDDELECIGKYGDLRTI